MHGEDLDKLLLAAGLLLLIAQILGQLAVRLKQPAVIGELLAGVILGPTLLGSLWPAGAAYIFPSGSALPLVLDGITKIAICLFLLVAGMEVDLIRVMPLRRAIGWVSIGGLAVPFAAGFVCCWAAPGFFGGSGPTPDLVLALFVASALSITALPVIAKILRDLELQRTDLGLVILSSGIFNDLAGWLVFGHILGLAGQAAQSDLARDFVLTLLFITLTLTAVRWLANWIMRRFAERPKPRRTLGIIAGVALVYSYLGHLIGVHPNFAAFLLGIALGNSPQLSEKTRHVFDQFVSQVLAPLFFAAIGLKVNFAEHFDALLVAAVITIASLSKIAGCTIGAKAGGFAWREAWAIGFGMNARGAVEIVLALLALESGLITKELFVALVVMALVTSVMSGSFMRVALAVRPAGEGAPER